MEKWIPTYFCIHHTPVYVAGERARSGRVALEVCGVKQIHMKKDRAVPSKRYRRVNNW